MLSKRYLKFSEDEKIKVWQETVISRKMGENSLRDALLKINQLADTNSLMQHLFNQNDLEALFDNFTPKIAECFIQCLVNNDSNILIHNMNWPKTMTIFTHLNKSPVFTKKELEDLIKRKSRFA